MRDFNATANRCLVAVTGKQVGISFSHGRRSLQTPRITETRGVNTPAGPCRRAFNGDGKLDIAMSAGWTTPVPGTGRDGTFRPPLP